MSRFRLFFGLLVLAFVALVAPERVREVLEEKRK
jgi:hypothetical protein